MTSLFHSQMFTLASHSPCLMRVVSNAICQYYASNESFCAWSCILIRAIAGVFLGVCFLLPLISSITLIWFCELLSQRSSKGYNCCIALSKVDFPVCTFAALVTPSFPIIRLSTVPVVQWFLLRSGPSIMTTSPVDNGGKFCFLLCILCFSRKDFKYSFSIFSMRYFYIFWYILLVCLNHHSLIQCHPRDSPYTKILGVTKGNCISSSR